MSFKVDKPAVERFIKNTDNLFVAVGLPLGADRKEVLDRIEAIRRVPSNAELNAAMASVAATIKQVRSNQAEWNDYHKRVRNTVTAALVRFLDTARAGDGVIDDKEEQDYYTFGLNSGLDRAELKRLFDKYVLDNNAQRKKAPAAKASTPRPAPPPRPAPTPRPAPAASKPAPTPRPAPTRSSSSSSSGTPRSPSRVGSMEERVRWGVVAATSSAGLGALSVVAFTHLGRPTLRMLVLAAMVAWAIHSLHERRLGQLVLAVAVAMFIASGNPIMLGVILGIVGAATAAWVTHWLRGQRALAAVLATLVFGVCLGSGMVQGSYYLKMPLTERPSRKAEVPSQPVVLPVSPPPAADAKDSTPSSPPPAVQRTTTPVAVKFTSTPEGAQVSLGGNRIGVTPCETKLKAGSYSVVLSKEGFEPRTVAFKVDPNQSVAARSMKVVTTTLSPLPTRAVEGTWTGTFDEKPFRLEITGVATDGSLTGNGAITLSSSTQTFRISGKYETTTKRIAFEDKGTGMQFTGALANGVLKGSAKIPSLELVREWSLTSTSGKQ